MSRESRYRLMFDLAWDGRGLTLILNDLPDHVLALISEWRTERVEMENAKLSRR